MLKSADEVRTQIAPNLQKLLNDIRLESDDPRPLMFGDEQEFKISKGYPFPDGVNACIDSSQNKHIIFLKQIDKIGTKEEDDIAHELGHLWLLLLGLPSERVMLINTYRQTNWDAFFGPLREIMEHAVYYPILKNKYQIDLYKIGNKRVADFITDQLPGLNNITANEKLFLILNYIKYEVESDDQYQLEKLHDAYSEIVSDVKTIADKVLHIVQKLAGITDAHLFISQYRKVLEILDTHFGVPAELWPNFVKQTNNR